MQVSKYPQLVLGAALLAFSAPLFAHQEVVHYDPRHHTYSVDRAYHEQSYVYPGRHRHLERGYASFTTTHAKRAQRRHQRRYHNYRATQRYGWYPSYCRYDG